MKENPARKGRLIILSFVCLVLLIPSLLAWIVNVELAFEVLTEDGAPTFLKSLIPGGIFSLFKPFCADLSTVTTLVPVLVFLYPILKALKIIGCENQDSSKLKHLDPDPYPSQFVLFMVLLGLAGTLYGMWIGLRVSGVDSLDDPNVTGGAIVMSIQNLLAGISTAILSSLAGLVGAFIAASPITRLFYWAACVIDEEEEGADFIETLTTLANNLTAGGQAVGGAATSTPSESASAGDQLAGGVSIQNDAMLNQLNSLVQAVRESNNEAKNNREALKKALAIYVSER